jgi:hypothetical protein
VNELVQRLSEGNHPITVGGPDPSLEHFKQSIERDYVHIKFTGTKGGTDLGVKIDKSATSLGSADFDQATGKVHIEGTLVLDYVPVRCIADIDLATLNGTGHLRIREETD